MSADTVDIVDESDSYTSNEKDFDSGDLSQSTVNRESVLCTWSHLRDFFKFDTHDKKTGKLSFQCLLCKPKEKYISASMSSNSNLRTHIKHIHPSKLDDFNKASKNRLRAVKRNLVHEKFDGPKPEPKQKKLDNFGKNNFLTKQKFNQVTLKLIINTASAFSLVEHEAFTEFCETTIQQMPMTRKTLMMHIDKTFKKMKMKLIEELKEEELVCVTADCWTAFRR